MLIESEALSAVAQTLVKETSKTREKANGRRAGTGEADRLGGPGWHR